MKAKFQFLSFFSAFLVLIACNKDKVSVVEDICHTWEVKSFMSLESVAYPKNENTPILLTFKKDGTYSLKLDINSCGGTFASGKNNQLEMDFPACTEACCDSQFSSKLATMLPQVTSYSIEGSILKLHVPQWGYIECEILSSSLINPNP
ncbi:MAG: META domain-containing protein [Bacteroidota bacterium]|nr:META domain-containing protein [Bacteroidota bacterium]